MPVAPKRREVIKTPEVLESRAKKLKLKETVVDVGTHVEIRLANPAELQAMERRVLSQEGQGEAEEEITKTVNLILKDAQRRMQDLLAEEAPATVKVEHASGEWWVRVLALDEQLAIGMSVAREISGRLDPQNQAHVVSIITASLQVCCVCGEDDLTPIFSSYPEALTLAQKRGKGDLATALFGGILEANPTLLKNLLAG